MAKEVKSGEIPPQTWEIMDAEWNWKRLRGRAGQNHGCQARVLHITVYHCRWDRKLGESPLLKTLLRGAQLSKLCRWQPFEIVETTSPEDAACIRARCCSDSCKTRMKGGFINLNE